MAAPLRIPQPSARKVPENVSKTEGIILLDWSTIPGRKGKRWQVRALDEMHKKLRGKTRYKSKRFDERSKAEEWGKDTKARLRAGTEQSGRLDLNDMLNVYLAIAAGRGNSVGHLDRVPKLLRRFQREAGITDLLASTTPVRAQLWLNGLRLEKQKTRIGELPGPASAGTKRTYGGIVTAWGEWMAESGYCSKSPFASLEMPEEEDGAEREPFNVAECRLLVSDKCTESIEGLFIALLLYSGMRLMELPWLRREQVDVPGLMLLIRKAEPIDVAESAAVHKDREARARRKVKEVYRKSVKWGKQRNARLEEEALPLFRRLLAGDPKGYLFPRRFRMMCSTEWTAILEQQCAMVGIDRRGRTCHCLRHTNICLLDAAGLGAASLMKHSGHADTKMLLHYAHHIDLMKRDCQGWQGCIRLRDKPMEGRAPQAPSSPTPSPLHSDSLCSECATTGVELRGSTVDTAEGGAALPVVITDVSEADNDEQTSRSSPGEGGKSSALPRSRQSTVEGFFSYDYTRKNHTECVTQGDVMTFRWAHLPVARIR